MLMKKFERIIYKYVYMASQNLKANISYKIYIYIIFKIYVLFFK